MNISDQPPTDNYKEYFNMTIPDDQPQRTAAWVVYADETKQQVLRANLSTEGNAVMERNHQRANGYPAAVYDFIQPIQTALEISDDGSNDLVHVVDVDTTPSNEPEPEEAPPPADDGRLTQLHGINITALRKKAAPYRIPGSWGMKKDELIAAILEAERLAQ